MNWRQLLTSPPPAAAWDLAQGDAVVVHRSGPLEFHCAAEELPEGCFEVGPVGLQAVDRKLAAGVLTRLRGAAEGVAEAAVIVPSSWLRCFLMDADRLPRREREVEDVVRWRLKKLLPVAPTELRLAIVRLPETAGTRRIVVLAGVERGIAALEAAFRDVGVEVGLVTTRLLSLAGRISGRQQRAMLIQVEDGHLSVMVTDGGVPRLLRTKPLPLRTEAAATIQRELRLTLEYVRDRIGLGGEIRTTVVCPKRELDAELRPWLADQPGVLPVADGPAAACGPTTVADRVGAARLAPALAVVTGAVR